MKREEGFTLFEVLCSLVISGILLISALNLFNEQWKNARAHKNRSEFQYTLLTTGKVIADEIRRANTVQWLQGTNELRILPLPDVSNPVPTQDAYFIADLDNDGVKDLYWKHLGVAQPLGSYLTSWDIREVEPGLWDISLNASLSGQSANWRLSVRQRVYTKSIS